MAMPMLMAALGAAAELVGPRGCEKTRTRVRWGTTTERTVPHASKGRG